MFFFLHYTDFIKGLILHRPWSDRFEIWRRGLGLIGLKYEQLILDLESRTFAFQSEKSASISGF